MSLRIAILALTCLLISACSTAYHLYGGPRRTSSEVALLKVRDVMVHSIDAIELPFGQRDGDFVVLPGEHKVLMALKAGSMRSTTALAIRFRAEAGRSYVVRPYIIGVLWRPDVIESDTGRSVGFSPSGRD